MPRKPSPRLRSGFARRTAARKRQGISPLRETGASAKGTSAKKRQAATDAAKRKTTVAARHSRKPSEARKFVAGYSDPRANTRFTGDGVTKAKVRARRARNKAIQSRTAAKRNKGMR